jgi:hypothetical protein
MRLRILLAGLLVACQAAEPAPEDPADDSFFPDGKEDSANFIEEGSWDAEAILRLVNVADYGMLADDVGLSARTAEALADATKPIDTLHELDDVRHVGVIAFQRLRDYARAHEYGPGLGEEYPPRVGEAEAEAGLLEIIASHVGRTYPAGTEVKRAQHAKAHGCVKALVTIENQELAAEHRSGLFAEETEYQAWVRFSNGNFAVKPDGDADARGMAVKLMGVEGRKAMPGGAGKTHDLLFINGPTMFVRNLLEYNDFTRRSQEASATSVLGYFLSLDPFELRIRGLRNLLEIFRAKVRNPLESQFWSTVPFALGPAAMKLSARPCGGSYVSPAEGTPDALRAALRASLERGEACFELLVQAQTDAREMPIEDGTVRWDEEASPYRHAGWIRIPQQTFDTPAQNGFCERLVFTPWHALDENRPLGGINRARLNVYVQMSKMRNLLNGAPSAEPTSWEIP